MDILTCGEDAHDPLSLTRAVGGLGAECCSQQLVFQLLGCFYVSRVSCYDYRV